MASVSVLPKGQFQLYDWEDWCLGRSGFLMTILLSLIPVQAHCLNVKPWSMLHDNLTRRAVQGRFICFQFYFKRRWRISDQLDESKVCYFQMGSLIISSSWQAVAQASASIRHARKFTRWSKAERKLAETSFKLLHKKTASNWPGRVQGVSLSGVNGRNLLVVYSHALCWRRGKKWEHFLLI